METKIERDWIIKSSSVGKMSEKSNNVWRKKWKICPGCNRQFDTYDLDFCPDCYRMNER